MLTKHERCQHGEDHAQDLGHLECVGCLEKSFRGAGDWRESRRASCVSRLGPGVKYLTQTHPFTQWVEGCVWGRCLWVGLKRFTDYDNDDNGNYIVCHQPHPGSNG